MIIRYELTEREKKAFSRKNKIDAAWNKNDDISEDVLKCVELLIEFWKSGHEVGVVDYDFEFLVDPEKIVEVLKPLNLYGKVRMYHRTLQYETNYLQTNGRRTMVLFLERI